jgi:putative Mg2+ transporter-C (MgtC) family protein
MNFTEQLLLLGNVALAFFLGGIIGLERESHEKPAGFRTHMLVCGSAAMLMGLSDPAMNWFGHGVPDAVRSDPLRVVQAIVLGIGFIGAGTIFHRDGNARVGGLTTAASLLMSASIGISVAIHQYVLAAGATVLTLVVLSLFGSLERRVSRKDGARPPTPPAS